MHTPTFAAALTAAFMTLSPVAHAQNDDFASLSSQYATWAGSKSNSDALVTGLRAGTSVTLVTNGNGGVSLAGFTPAKAMTYGEIRSALASARKTLSDMGVARPTAEQIQTALIGGEITTASGASRQVAGLIGVGGMGRSAAG
jgi:hypothetical protein